MLMRTSSLPASPATPPPLPPIFAVAGRTLRWLALGTIKHAKNAIVSRITALINCIE